MQILIEQDVYVKWKAPSNSSVDGTIACYLPKNIIEFETNYPPQIGETIYIENLKEIYQVKELKRHIIIGKASQEKFIIKPQAKTLTVDYYDYMKTFTHCCDRMKSDSDPTKDLKKLNEPVILPDTWDEWMQKIIKLTNK